MALWRLFYLAVIDALFPLSPEEEAISAMSPEEALNILPAASKYDRSVVPLPECQSIFAYKDNRVARLIWCVKYKASAHAVKIGGYALFINIVADKNLISKPIIIVPIPITARRRRERGYNQCEILAAEIGKLDGEIIIENNLLVRIKNSDDQKTKDRKSRLEGSHGIFAVRKDYFESNRGANINKNTPIIVLDDVITTGSTMKEAIDTLKDAGFADVRGLSLAH